jgi:CheY-like chemotaxis protein
MRAWADSHLALIWPYDPGVVRLLIVEDEVKMAGLIRRGLREEGMAADVAVRGEDALWMAGATQYDAIVMDVMLPGIDGFQTCRRLREQGVWAPVLMLTARDAVEVLVRRAACSAASPRPTWVGRAADRDRGGRTAPRPGLAPGMARGS